MQFAVMHATFERMFDCLIIGLPLSADFAARSLTDKPHDCVENMVLKVQHLT